MGDCRSFNNFYTDSGHRPNLDFSSTRSSGKFQFHAKSHETNGKHDALTGFSNPDYFRSNIF
jgi:hypothetical protein